MENLTNHSSCCSTDLLEETPSITPLIVRTVIAISCALILSAHMILPIHSILHNSLVQLILCIPTVLIGVEYFGRSAIESLRESRKANMDLLICIGFLSAFIYSLWIILIGKTGEMLYFETSASIVAYVLLGNLIEKVSIEKTSTSIKELLLITPTFAKRIKKSGIAQIIEDISADEVVPGDTILVNSGDKIPVDGNVIRSDALVNESWLTGESTASEKFLNDPVFAGTFIEKGSLEFKASSTKNNSTISEIIRTIKIAKNSKPNIQRIADYASSIFVPCVILFSVSTLFLNILITNNILISCLRAVAVLVVACPCAMGLATPTAVMVGLGRASKNGILVKGGEFFERLSKVQQFVFDKTGTLTNGKFKIDSISTFEFQEKEAFSIIKTLESRSNHPIAKSLSNILSNYPLLLDIQNIIEEKGLGITAEYPDGRKIKFGSALANPGNNNQDNFDLNLFIDNKQVAGIKLSDEISSGSLETVQYLNKINLPVTLISGDNEKKCLQVSKYLGIDRIFFQQLPAQKLNIIQQMQTNSQIAFVGDGINDTLSLSAASVGISFGNASPTAINCSSVVILSNDLTKIPLIHKLSIKVVDTIKQNLYWAFFYNALMIPLAAVGILSPGIAAFCMAMSDVFVIGNSLRLRSAILK